MDSNKKYPVLYLLHGYSDDPSAWTSMGKANIILHNPIAQGKAKPMIMVMPLGYVTINNMITLTHMGHSRNPQFVQGHREHRCLSPRLALE